MSHEPGLRQSLPCPTLPSVLPWVWASLQQIREETETGLETLYLFLNHFFLEVAQIISSLIIQEDIVMLSCVQ